MIISGYTRVGLIIFDKTPRVVGVISWSDYLRTEIVEPIEVFEKVNFRFGIYNNTLTLIAEVHAITGIRREPRTHYLWEFTYAPNTTGSSFRYCMKDTGWSPLPERINRGSQQ